MILQYLASTCWTVRGETLEYVLKNHAESLELGKWSLNNFKNTNMKERIIRVVLR